MANTGPGRYIVVWTDDQSGNFDVLGRLVPPAGELTTYTLDLTVGLTQVLDDGSNTYLYGLGRIGGEQAGGWVLHLSDGLGSVRQLWTRTAR